MRTIKKISTRSLRDNVYMSIRDAIINGFFMPGSSITIMGIAEMVGTSAMPVREALRQLAAEGALEILPNRTIALPLLTRGEFDDLTALRCHLECIVAERSIAHATEADLKKLDILNAKMKRAREKKDVDTHLRTNWEFHLTLYKLSGSGLYIELIEKLWLKIGPLIRFAIEEADFSNAAGYHQLAVAAIRARDAAEVRRAIEQDIVTTATEIRSWYKFKSADASDLVLSQAGS